MHRSRLLNGSIPTRVTASFASREPNSASLYFNQNAYTPDGRHLIITSPGGLSTIDLQTHEIQRIVDGKVGVICAGRKSGDIYYVRKGTICAVNIATRTSREIIKLPFRGSVQTINADETLLAGAIIERKNDDGTYSPISLPSDDPIANPGTGSDAPGVSNRDRSSESGAPDPANPGSRPTTRNAVPLGPDGKPLNKADAKEVLLDHRLNKRTPMALFIVNIQSGQVRFFNHCTDWLNHLQFSPTDPNLLMFCHEGPWHKVDRIWTIRTDGTGLTSIHHRTMTMEIAGHEFFSHDGNTIWYDLQTPRGEDFWVAGYNLATTARTWYHLNRDQWSVHFNVSPDGSLFAGDGGDSEMVAHAKDGKWIYLLRPHLVPNAAGLASDQKGLIQSGVFEPERLVNMSKHNYHLEPNVSFTPDQKWIIFRSNMFGPTQVFAVEVNKSK